jgi:hypothetical protein
MALTMLLGLLIGRHRWPDRIAELMPAAQGARVGAGRRPRLRRRFDHLRLNRTPGPSPIKLAGSVAP